MFSLQKVISGISIINIEYSFHFIELNLQIGSFIYVDIFSTTGENITCLENPDTTQSQQPMGGRCAHTEWPLVALLIFGELDVCVPLKGFE